MYFDTDKDYDNYLEEEDMHIIYRIMPLYDSIKDDMNDEFKYFIR